MDHGDRRSGAAARPWRGAGSVAAGPPPPKVYRVEPRDFRELVQRLTGAGTPAAAPAPRPAHQRVTLTPPAMVVADSSRRAQAAAAVPVPGAIEQQFDYASWFSAPLLSPAAYGAPGFGGGGHHQHQGSSGPLL